MYLFVVGQIVQQSEAILFRGAFAFLLLYCTCCSSSCLQILPFHQFLFFRAGSLMPSHPYILPVLEVIREKYNIPETAPGDDTLAEILGSENEIDLEALHQDIETELRKNPEFLPPEAKSIYKLFF